MRGRGVIAAPPLREAVSPVRRGIVTDVEGAARAVRAVLRGSDRLGVRSPRVMASVPANATHAERAALAEACYRAGAGSVTIVPALFSAALGSGVDLTRGAARLIVDLGAGLTEVGTIRSGRLIAGAALPIGCIDLRQGIRRAVKDAVGATLDDRATERLLRVVGATQGNDGADAFFALGADTAHGFERHVWTRRHELESALAPALNTVFGFLSRFVKSLPAVLAPEVAGSGVTVTGGGALLPGIAERLKRSVGIPVEVGFDPRHAVIHGVSRLLELGDGVGHWDAGLIEHWPDPWSGPRGSGNSR